MTAALRRMMVSAVMGGTMAIFKTLQKVHVHDGAKFEKAVRTGSASGGGCRESQPLSGTRGKDDDCANSDIQAPVITVCNHLSIVDDPCICGVIAPSFFSLFNRWGLCAEEICFKRDLYAWGFGIGNILPILRGIGTEQENLFLLMENVRPGMWINLFPEGRVWQDPEGGKPHANGVGGARGYLKWGTAKVLLHAYPYQSCLEEGWTVRSKDSEHPLPVLLPFVHRG